MDVTRTTSRIAHVMQTVVARHKVEAGFLDVLSWRLFEADAIAQSVCDGMSISLFDGRPVEIVPHELTFWKSLRHQQRRKADAAPDVGHFGAGLQLSGDAVKGWQPMLHNVVHI